MHQPVLVNEIVEYLNPQPGKIYVDGTAGGGGHTRALLEAAGPTGRVIAFDRDHEAIARLTVSLGSYGSRLELVQASYEQVPEILRQKGIANVQGIVLDLGLSSDQLDDQERGFSFQSDGPLDLRFDTTDGQPAHVLLSQWQERELADILFYYGDLRGSRTLAQRIKEYLKNHPIDRTHDLLRATGVTHPRVKAQLFQALRIATNDEIGGIKRSLPALWSTLTIGGRLAIISFHSGEDRLIKRQFKEWSDQGEGHLMQKKPLIPSSAEQKDNPRSRSAKLRVIEKINHK